MEDSGQASNLTVGAASTAVIRKRPYGTRIAFSITNYSALIVYLNLSDDGIAAIGEGIPLYPGCTLSDSSSDRYKCWQGAVTAIEATGAATLSIWERVGL